MGLTCMETFFLLLLLMLVFKLHFSNIFFFFPSLRDFQLLANTEDNVNQMMKLKSKMYIGVNLAQN